MILRTNKDKKLITKVHALELKKLQYKYLLTSVLNNPKISRKEKAKFFSAISKQRIENASKTRIVKRCLLTHKPRVMYKTFKLYRMKLKEMLDKGVLPGYKKAAW